MTGGPSIRSIRRHAASVSDRQHAQATIELIALAPLILLCGVLLMNVVSFVGVAVAVDHVASAAARAKLTGTDPLAAARTAMPGWAAGRAEVSVSGESVAVSLRPRSFVPGIDVLPAVTQRVRVDSGSGRW